MSGVSAFMNFASIIAHGSCLTDGSWRSRLLTSLVAAIGMFVTVCATPAAQAARIAPLEIVTKSGVQVFSVEMATTEDEKTTGLMYRKELADGKGMLFDFSPEQQVSMWVKNTYISLDMIFIRADGRILRIAVSCGSTIIPTLFPPRSSPPAGSPRACWK